MPRVFLHLPYDAICHVDEVLLFVSTDVRGPLTGAASMLLDRMIYLCRGCPSRDPTRPVPPYPTTAPGSSNRCAGTGAHVCHCALCHQTKTSRKIHRTRATDGGASYGMSQHGIIHSGRTKARQESYLCMNSEGNATGWDSYHVTN